MTRAVRHMTKKANQHYVPQFYFRYFSETGKDICVLNRKTGTTINSASIKGQASKKYFYGDSDIEDQISKIEGFFSSALSSIRNPFTFENCSYDSYFLILQNLMLQKARTVTARQKNKAGEDRLLQLYLECEITNDQNLDAETKKAFYEIARNVEADPKQYQLMGMTIAIETAEALTDLFPIIIKNLTFKPFIFSDSPVIFINPLQKKIRLRGVLGANTPGLIIMYPLGPRHCLMLIDQNSYRIKKLKHNNLSIRNNADVAKINKLQIHNSANAVYFSKYKYKNYVYGLWNQEKSRLQPHEGKVVEAPGFYHTGEPMEGDILHVYEKQLPLVPRFSFLDYEETEENEYKFERRKEIA